MDVTLLWPWMLGLVVLVTIALVALGFALPKRRRDRGVPVAHVDRLTSLGVFRAALLRYRFWMAAGVLFAIVGATTAGVLASRPAGVSTNSDEEYKRDIMLCLDVSGSMLEVDAQILGVYQSLADGLNGERIGMRIFDASSVMAFPLTSDYEYISNQLSRYQRALSGTLGPDEQFNYQAGTSSGLGASLVGDGLASCVLDFADLEQSDRPRSVILATDNYVNGQQLFSVEQAAALAVEEDVRVYSINPVLFGSDEYADELKKFSESTGGAYFELSFASTVPEIVSRVNSIEAGYIETPPLVQIIDRPGALPFLVLLSVGALCVFVWRARL